MEKLLTEGASLSESTVMQEVAKLVAVMAPMAKEYGEEFETLVHIAEHLVESEVEILTAKKRLTEKSAV